MAINPVLTFISLSKALKSLIVFSLLFLFRNLELISQSALDKNNNQANNKEGKKNDNISSKESENFSQTHNVSSSSIFLFIGIIESCRASV